MTKQRVHIIGGGTSFHIRPHLALSALAYGMTPDDIRCEVEQHPDFEGDVYVHMTRMAGGEYSHIRKENGEKIHMDLGPDGLLNAVMNGNTLETNADVGLLIDKLVADPEPKIIFFPAALVDFEVDKIGIEGVGQNGDTWAGDLEVGKSLSRLSTHHEGQITLKLKPAEKIIRKIRQTRKDIFLVGFKTTTGADPQEQFEHGLRLLKEASCNLVLANDIHTELNMVITPEQAPYYVTKERSNAIEALVDMALLRARGRFTRSTVMGADYVKWSSPQIPESLRKVVDHCISRGAYKPFMGKTVGHFAVKRDPMTFFTSMRGKDFNKLGDPHSGVGMVQVRLVGEDEVVAYGGKPSVGGQSQRIIFHDHPNLDCIVHFHCPLRPEYQNDFATRSQVPYECGSHECGQNTSDGLEVCREDANGRQLKAVMLDRHGPNIVFHRDYDPDKVIEFIEQYWDLERSTSEIRQ